MAGHLQQPLEHFADRGPHGEGWDGGPLRAAERRSGDGEPQPSEPVATDQSLGWASVTQGGVDVITAGGDHMTMMREPFIESTGAALRREIDAAIVLLNNHYEG